VKSVNKFRLFVKAVLVKRSRFDYSPSSLGEEQFAGLLHQHHIRYRALIYEGADGVGS
jgi:hypothetical protein